MDSLCHPCITTTHLSYSVLSLKLPPPPCAVLLVHILWSTPATKKANPPILNCRPSTLEVKDVKTGCYWRITKGNGPGPNLHGTLPFMTLSTSFQDCVPQIVQQSQKRMPMLMVMFRKNIMLCMFVPEVEPYQSSCWYWEPISLLEGSFHQQFMKGIDAAWPP